MNYGISFNDAYLMVSIKFDGTKYTLRAWNNELSFTRQASYNTSNPMSHADNLGYLDIGTLYQVGNASNQYYKSFIELKQFSITVDGKEVFNGNKTGLDVIKPDNYTVVGSPVISEDGVASGFDSANANNIQISTAIVSQIATANTWKVEVSGTVQESGFTYGNIRTDNIIRYDLIQINRYQKGFLFVCCLDMDGTTRAKEIHIEFSNTYNGKAYKATLEFTGTKYIATLIFEDGTTLTNSLDNTYKIKLFNYGDKFELGYKCINGSIDLNAFKIYVDDDLVYQPCLKIPYTQSKTGSKIVDVAYRDRVIDLYEQEGQAGSYTIDEDNKNFTLPMGEVYGMIEQKADAGRIGEQLAGKVNLDLANLSSEGKEAMTAYWIASGSPTINIPINLTISTTTQYWEAPSNGYVWFYMASASSGAVGFIGVKEEYPDLWSIGNIGRGWLYINKGQHLSVRTDVGTFTLGVLLFTAKQ